MNIPEETLKKSGLDFTIIQAPYFSENFLSMTNEIKCPLRDGYIPMISVLDLGAVCAHILQAEDITPYKNQTFKITATEAYTGQQIAAIMSKVLNREIKYANIPAEEFKKMVMDKGAAEWQAQGVVELIDRYALKKDKPTDHFRKIVGKDPISFEQLCIQKLRG